MLRVRYQKRKKTSCTGEKGYDIWYLKISEKAEKDRIQTLGCGGVRSHPFLGLEGRRQ